MMQKKYNDRIKLQSEEAEAAPPGSEILHSMFWVPAALQGLMRGTFVHHVIVDNIAPADTAISNILGGSVKLFTTRCVLAELKRPGKSYDESLEAAKLLMMARCDHEKIKSAAGCILEIIREKIPDHFFVGSQETDMLKKFHEASSGLVHTILVQKRHIRAEAPGHSCR
ncbi:unnamed protein product [Dovyalis caffra]|uniref:Uncharacterized protein n=1 Tax=Dovyalis caffra TaxID=77055 RepID=A0AAV1R9J8_9ROSI|nr:unnamed protein product [Dovyalis caffra]